MNKNKHIIILSILCIITLIFVFCLFSQNSPKNLESINESILENVENADSIEKNIQPENKNQKPREDGAKTIPLILDYKTISN